ncbi:hypothetical protein BJY52DRAFT_1291591 [Lactarius psammicola]|nr:hypothetical protein BJY52DRAFT_1291591 [Lactarius psammicola]
MYCTGLTLSNLWLTHFCSSLMIGLGGHPSPEETNADTRPDRGSPQKVKGRKGWAAALAVTHWVVQKPSKLRSLRHRQS